MALGVQPGNTVALLEKARSLRELNRLEEAIENYGRVLRQQPDSIEALIDSSTCHRKAMRFAESDAVLEIALACCADPEAMADRRRPLPRPRDRLLAEAHASRGVILLGLRRFAESRVDLQRAIDLDPDLVDARWNLVCELLGSGDYAEGWRHYEARRLQKKTNWTRLDGPEWTGGKPVNGKRVFVYAEQAMGDALQCVRFAGMLAERGADISLGIHRPLTALFKSLNFDADLVPYGEHTGAHDFHVPLMSLPLALGVREERLAANVPYLRAEPERVARWRARLPSDGLKIGLVWQGSADDHRSIPLVAYAPLGRVAGVTFVSLHRLEESAQLASAPQELRIMSFGAELDADGAYLDTAAIMESLDLIITCDSSLGHLGGALGRPVWGLLSEPADWRFMLDREDSPWYPGHRLIRQTAPGQWAEVLERAAALLARVAAGDRRLLAFAPASAGR